MAYSLFPGGVLRDDGAAIPAIRSNVDYQAYLSWVAAGNTAAPYVPPAVSSAVLAPLAFIARFTASEQAAVATAAQTSAAMMLWLLQCAGATEIDVTDPRVPGGIDALIAAGLLAPSRKPTLLAPP